MGQAERHNWHSFMAVPLFGRQKQPLGSLSLYGKETAKFGESEVNLMKTFAGQVAVALENSQLAKRLDVQLQSLHQLGQTEGGQGVLHLIVEESEREYRGDPRVQSGVTIRIPGNSANL